MAAKLTFFKRGRRTRYYWAFDFDVMLSMYCFRKNSSQSRVFLCITNDVMPFAQMLVITKAYIKRRNWLFPEISWGRQNEISISALLMFILGLQKHIIWSVCIHLLSAQNCSNLYLTEDCNKLCIIQLELVVNTPFDVKKWYIFVWLYKFSWTASGQVKPAVTSAAIEE